jgi:hypothetical protein
LIQPGGKNPGRNAGRFSPRRWSGSGCSAFLFAGVPSAGALVVEEGQTQLGDLFDQPFQPPVIVDPLLYLIHEILGDIDGLGFPFDLEGQDMGRMSLPFCTPTIRLSAFSMNLDQGSGDEGPDLTELLQLRVPSIFEDFLAGKEFHE